LNVSLHPVLYRRGYLGAYLGVWLILAWLLVFLLSVSGGIGFDEVLALLVPMSLLYAGVCLSAWYACKATPLRTSGVARLFATHLTAGFALSYLWMQTGAIYAKLLNRSARFPEIEAHYFAHKSVLLVGGVMLYLLVVGFFYVVAAIETSREAESRAAETGLLAREAELRALRAQINPHFLFNSLNSISALTSIDPARAREMCLLLADFLRLTLGMGERAVILFSEELDFLHKFLAIEKIRFGERLRMEEQISADTANCSLPALLLQPLLENAVSHGIASMAEGGLIRLQAAIEGGRMVIIVENDRDDEAPKRRSNGVGLRNVRSRLEARYGKNATMHTEASEDKFRVSMSFPAEFAEAKAAAPVQVGATQ
jgi:hypothetical protein